MSPQPTSTNAIRAARAGLALEYPMSLGTFDKYEEAQAAVDYLSDHEFPVQHVMIVGTDLKQLERVTGRLTSQRVLLGGLLSGAWMGFFVGLVFALFDDAADGLVRIISTVIFGAIFGLIWAYVGYRATGGRRDFTSVTQVVATRYEVLTEHKHVAQARELITQMDPYKAAQAQVRQAQEAELRRTAEQQPQMPPTPPAADPR